jgi:replicative DNA helicase
MLTTGFHPSDLVIVAARPGMGKSSFMLSMVLNLAFEEKVPLAIFSLEMSKEQLVMRMLSMLSGVGLQNIRKGFISEEDWRKLLNSALELSSRDIYIDDTPTLSTTELRIKSRKLKKEKNVGIIFVDYLQLLRAPHRRSSRQEEVAEISRNLKALAKEIQVPVVALAQLSRQVEHRSDKRPQLADLRESGQIEQDADLITFYPQTRVLQKEPISRGGGYSGDNRGKTAPRSHGHSKARLYEGHNHVQVTFSHSLRHKDGGTLRASRRRGIFSR